MRYLPSLVLIAAGCIQAGMPSTVLEAEAGIHDVWMEVREDSIFVHVRLANYAKNAIDGTLTVSATGTRFNESLSARAFELDVGGWHQFIRNATMPGHTEFNLTVHATIFRDGPEGSGMLFYRLPCFSENNGQIGRDESCRPWYIVFSDSKYYEKCGTFCWETHHLSPSDPFFRERAWECCRLRTFPAHDIVEAHEVALDRSVDVRRAFPVVEGAVLAEVTAGLASNLTPAFGSYTLIVADAAGREVGRAEGDENRTASVILPDPEPGVYVARVLGEAAPGNRLDLEIHVDDGVYPRP